MPESVTARLPYPGLRPFEADEADLFFGREQQVDALLKRLSRSHFVAVVGESGAGKSSLVRAGLLPALEAGFVVEAGSNWRVALMRPGIAPLEAMAEALLAPRVLTDTGGLPQREFALAELRRGPLGLVQLVGDAHLEKSCNLLLVVDQFEELFRYCRNSAQKDQASVFVELLLHATQQRQVSISVVLTMRSDFVGDCARFCGLPEKLNDNQFLTPRLRRDQIAAAIQGPARVCGGGVDPDLVDELCNAVGDNQDQLPLLQHLLMRVWERARLESSPPRLTRELSRSSEIGGLKSALSKHAEQIYHSLRGDPERAIACALFKSLTDPFSQRRDVRRDASVSEIAAVANATLADVINVAEEFRAVGRHMLVPPPHVPLTATSRLDISHESLIRQWSMLSGWAADETANAHEFVDLRREALHDRKDRELLSGRNLARAVDWIKQARPTRAWAERYAPTGALEATLAFIAESEKKEADKREEELRQVRREAVTKRRRVYNWVLVGMLAIAMGFALSAHKAGKLARARQLAADAMLELPNDPGIAVNLAHQAALEVPSEERAVQALRSAIAAHVPNLELAFSVAKKKNYVPGTDKGSFLLSALSPSSLSSSGNLAIVPFADRATVFSVLSGEPVGMPLVIEHAATATIVGSAILSPDGRIAVTTSGDGWARVWDTATSRITETIKHNAPLNGAAFSPDGRLLVTLSDDHHAKILNVGTYSERCNLNEEDSGEEFLSASFSQDQKYLITLSSRGMPHVWELAQNGCPESTDPGLEEALRDGGTLTGAGFSDHGPYLGLVNLSGAVRVLSWADTGWKSETALDPQTTCPDASYYAPEDLLPALAWSSDGRYFAAAGCDNVVRVAEIAGYEWAAQLKGHTGRVTSMSFSPRGNILLTTSADHTARVWKFRNDPVSSYLDVEETLVLRGHKDTVGSGVFSAAGTIITASDDTTVRLWTPLFSLQEFPLEEPVAAASLSANGERLWLAGASTISEFAATHSAKAVRKLPANGWKELYKTADPGTIAYTPDLDSTTIKLLGLHDVDFYSRVSISPDGRFVVSDAEGNDRVEVWNVDTSTVARHLPRPREATYRALAISSDGERLAWYSRNQDCVLITRVGQPDIAYAVEAEKIVESMRFSGNGQKLALTLEDYSVQILDLDSDTGLAEKTLRGHTGQIQSVNFSHDDGFIASVSADATARVWDVTTGTQIAQTVLPDRYFDAVSFSADGLSLLLVGDHRMLVWQCSACGSAEHLIRAAQQRLIRGQ